MPIQQKVTCEVSLEAPQALSVNDFSTNGAKRIRTADPCNAIAVLYQLSYNP
jgi:hypothetical protein